MSREVNCTARVVSAEPGDRFLRVRLEASAFARLIPLPGDAIKVLLPRLPGGKVDLSHRDADGLPTWGDSEQPLLRALTVAAVDGETMTVLVLRRAGSPLAERLIPGAHVGVGGMRFGVVPPGGVRVLVAGDRSALPAAEQVAAAAGTEPVIDDDAGRLLARATAGPAPGWAWVGAEDGVVAELRARLLARGVAPEAIHAIGQWRSGVDADTRDAALRPLYAGAARDGLDIADPAVGAELEFGAAR